MADSKKSALLQAANKLKTAKKNKSTIQQENGSKSIKTTNIKGSALTEKIKDAVSKFDRD